MTQLTFVVGLPGSGKSHYTTELVRKTGAKAFDDYKKNSYGHNPLFWKSRKYHWLIKNLKKGKDCIVNDVSFYKADSRQEALQRLTALAHQFDQQIDIEWIFFRKDIQDIEACVRNVCYRAWKKGRSLQSIPILFEYAVLGDISENAEVRPAWTTPKSYKIPEGVFSNEEILAVHQAMYRKLAELHRYEGGQAFNWADATEIFQIILRTFSEQLPITSI